MAEEGSRSRNGVLEYYGSDIMVVVETRLKDEEAIIYGGYKWYGNNRKKLKRGAVRGSGGVGVLVKEELLQVFTIETLDSNIWKIYCG